MKKTVPFTLGGIKEFIAEALGGFKKRNITIAMCSSHKVTLRANPRLEYGVSLPKGESVKTIYLALLLLAPVAGGAMAGGAVDISVGGVSLTIPSPEGFSPVTPQMAPLYTPLQLYVPGIEQFAAFIPEKDVHAALEGNLPYVPSRRFTVQTTKEDMGDSVSISDFEELKSEIKTYNDEIVGQTEAVLPGLVSDLELLPVHEETDRTLAYSMFSGMDGERGVVTTTFVHVKDKVLSFYCIAEESGLEWTREASRQWARAVIAENSESNVSVVGIIIGLVIIGLVGWTINRSRAS